jgi:hypothetical protein
VWYRLSRDPKGHDPGTTRILFEGSKHFGRTFRDVPLSYLDWLLGQPWLDPASYLGRMLSLYLGRLAESNLTHLEQEAFDTRGFSPLDAMPGERRGTVMVQEQDPLDPHWRTPPDDWIKPTVRKRKPSTWMQRRPREQIEAEDEAINQRWTHSHGQRLLWEDGLDLPPMPVLHGRKGRNRVYWTVIDGEPVLKGKEDDGLRVVAWDRCMEAIDAMGTAQDLESLDDRHQRAALLTRLLSQSEGWAEDGNALMDELKEVYLRRKDQLERREESLTDLKEAVVTDGEGTRQKGRHRSVGRGAVQKIAADMQGARITEGIRMMRGCRTLDDLADVAMWIRNHREDFTEDSLSKLRGWHAFFQAEIVKEQLAELQAKYGPPRQDALVAVS